MCKDLPPGPPTKDSALGTAKHAVAAACLLSRIYEQRAADFLLGSIVEADGFKFPVDSSFVDQVNEYVATVRREPGELFVEERLDTSEILGVPDQGGTADAVILDAEKRQIVVGDAKFGHNVVYARDNEQLMLYAAAARRKFDLVCAWQSVKIFISQPSAGHYDEAVYTRAEMERFTRRIRKAAQLAIEDNPSLTPGKKQCQWCPVRGACPARAASIANLFEGRHLSPQPALLNDSEIAESLTRCDEIENWCRDIRAEALKRALAGKTLPGFKVVQGKRGARYWIDTAKAEAALLLVAGEKAYQPREIITPSAAEKLLRKGYASLQGLVDQKEGSLSITPESDSRPAHAVTSLEFEAYG